jgi:hypothetical protein
LYGSDAESYHPVQELPFQPVFKESAVLNDMPHLLMKRAIINHLGHFLDCWFVKKLFVYPGYSLLFKGVEMLLRWVA